MSNPLLKIDYQTPHNTIPFDKIKVEHFLPAIKAGIKAAQLEIDTIVKNTLPPTFVNVVEALEGSGLQLSIASSVFFNLNSAHTSDEMQKIAQEVSPLLSEHGNNILFNTELARKVFKVYDEHKNSTELNTEQKRLLEKTYKSFQRNGARLAKDKQDRLREIDRELGLLSLKFGENLLKETNNYELHIEKEVQLSGLPESAIEAAAQTAKERNKDGWVFTLDYPSFNALITYCDDRAIREEIYRAFSTRANKDNEFDNKECVLKIVQYREEKANILGYPNYAAYVLEERMAKNSKTVFNFIEQLFPPSHAGALKDFEELNAFAKENDGPDILQRWDAGYYAEKLKQEKLSFDAEKLKPYFQLENVIAGVFQLANDLFGLTFKESNEIPKYHEDVKTYEILNADGSLAAIFYGDFFPRPSKRQGAWMTEFKSQYKMDDVNHRPHVANVCNFTKPTPTKPSLLTFDEVLTLFHEFGHGLHSILTDCTYSSLAGTSVQWDFVELPSQLLENWCYEKECLDKFAKHYETGEPIPSEYIEQIIASKKFRAGSASLRQLSLGYLDMQWHTTKASEIKDVYAFEKESVSRMNIYPEVKGSMISPQFGHLFQGGYAAGYYSYKWAEVLDADVFETFLENGIYDKATAESLRANILSKGGTEDPEELFVRFKGKKANPEALLRRTGLIN
jgi:peptidyl-dipeptidase Dcp